MNYNNEYRILNILCYIELQIGSIMIEIDNDENRLKSFVEYNDPHEK